MIAEDYHTRAGRDLLAAQGHPVLYRHAGCDVFVQVSAVTSNLPVKGKLLTDDTVQRFLRSGGLAYVHQDDFEFEPSSGPNPGEWDAIEVGGVLLRVGSHRAHAFRLWQLTLGPITPSNRGEDDF